MIAAERGAARDVFDVFVESAVFVDDEDAGELRAGLELARHARRTP